MKHSTTKLSIFRDNICRKIGTDAEICFQSSPEGSVVAITIKDNSSIITIVTDEVSNLLARGEHSELFIIEGYVKYYQETYITRESFLKITAFASPLSQGEVAAILFNFSLGTELFISGADMPLTLAIKVGQQHWGQSEFSSDEYEILWQVG